jgi:predicted nucleic acid-binding protein
MQGNCAKKHGGESVVLFDTDIIIELLKNNKHILEIINSIGYSSIAINHITQMELFYGALNNRELERIKKVTESLMVIPVTIQISSVAVELMGKYTKSYGLEIPDALIAACAIENHFPLFTNNRKDFRFIRELELFKF